jgi:hypothetical protein
LLIGSQNAGHLKSLNVLLSSKRYEKTALKNRLSFNKEHDSYFWMFYWHLATELKQLNMKYIKMPHLSTLLRRSFFSGLRSPRSTS